MLFNVNVLTYKFLYINCLLFELYKHLIDRFYLPGQFVRGNFAKLLKQSLDVVVILIRFQIHLKT